MKAPFIITLQSPDRLGYFGQSLAIQVCIKHLKNEADVSAIERDGKTTLVVHSDKKACHCIEDELHALEKELTCMFIEAYHLLLKRNELYAPSREPYLQAS